jgi:integrase/recombinase XerD
VYWLKIPFVTITSEGKKGPLMTALQQVVDSFLVYCSKDLGLAEKTVDDYYRVLNKLVSSFPDRSIESITIDELNEYFRELEETRAISSVNTYRRIVKSLICYCQYYRRLDILFDHGMIRSKKEPSQPIRFATVEDVNRVLFHLDDYQDRLIVLTLFQTQMRIGELVKMRVEHMYGNDITVIGKGGKKRLVCVTPELGDALRKHLKNNRIYTGTVFRHRVARTSLSSEAYTVSGLRNRFIRRLSPHGIHAGFHWYRHGGATEMMRQGAGMRFVQEYLGHADIRTTQRYTHITDSHKRESFDKYFTANISVRSAIDIMP